jgi:hypothetical protein
MQSSKRIVVLVAHVYGRIVEVACVITHTNQLILVVFWRFN